MTVALILYKFSLVQIITTFKQYQTTFRLKGHEKKSMKLLQRALGTRSRTSVRMLAPLF